jgi:glutathione S-transferase
VVTKAMGWELAPERSVMAGWGSFERTLDAVEGAVGGREHLAGERFSAADLYLGSLLSWGMKFGILPKRPAFETYVGGLTSRPAYARAAVLDAAAGQAAT